jgi:hypothetical protein
VPLPIRGVLGIGQGMWRLSDPSAIDLSAEMRVT